MIASILVLLVLIVPAFASCSGTSSSNTFIELLNLVPADMFSGEARPFLSLIDYASLYKDTGITFTTGKELIENTQNDKFSYSVLGFGSYITGHGKYTITSTILDKYVGYDVTNIDAEIQFGVPPVNGVAAIGRFNPQDTSNALSNRDEWPSWAVTAYTAEEYHGVTIHSWGDGLKINLQTPLTPPHVDELGRGRPLAVTEKNLFYAGNVKIVKLMIDASEKKSPRIADLPEYASIANALVDLKVYCSIVASEYWVYVLPEYSADDTGPRLKKFLTFSSGLGRDEKGTYTAIVIYHKDTAHAQANVSLLKQRIENSSSIYYKVPWSEKITDSEIKSEGNILLAKLYPTETNLWATWFYSQDNLLLHED